MEDKEPSLPLPDAVFLAEKTFKRLAEKLNKLMRTDIIGDTEEKPIPYLGWYWRDISPDIPVLFLSKPDKAGHWWIDEARKWDYPSKRVETEKAIEILENAIDVVEAYTKLIQSLGDEPDRNS